MRTGKIISKTFLASAIIAATMAAQSAKAEQSADKLTLAPGNGMSFVAGSKKAMTVFQTNSGACDVTILISEVDPVQNGIYQSASRVKVQLTPGNATSVDSSEGRSIRFVCNQDAKSLTISNEVLKVSSLY